jgi:hypothetical protein
VPHNPISELAEIGSRRGHDFSLTAERLDETTWVVRAELL